MKRFLASFLFLGVTLSTYAQLSPQMEAYIRANPRRAAGVVHAYEFLPLKDTPAPKGFQPFYISHYGRHGSRSNWGGTAYEGVISVLEAGKAIGILTPDGEMEF